jgi:hypothetical protein
MLDIAQSIGVQRGREIEDFKTFWRFTFRLFPASHFSGFGKETTKMVLCQRTNHSGPKQSNNGTDFKRALASRIAAWNSSKVASLSASLGKSIGSDSGNSRFKGSLRVLSAKTTGGDWPESGVLKPF